jgi:GT2 family glycosyltransferase
MGLLDVSSVKQPIGIRFTWKSNTPSLAIIILTKNNHKFLQSLLPVLQHQLYQRQFTINIVDNGSDDPATIAFYQEIQTDPQLSIIPYPKPFNYSEAINLGVANTESDLVLLMNDDMEPMDEIWLEELSQWAVRPEIGVVGAKLLRKNRTIQHAGIILGLTGFMGHIYLNAPEDYNGLLGSANWYRNYLAMTGACQMVRREVFDEVGGYDEGYQLAFGDVDFCLKVHQKGYQNIYTPFAQSYHYEGSSRGYQTPVVDVLRGYDQMAAYLINEDPYFSPNLTYTRIPKCALEARSAETREKQIAARKSFYLKQ